MSALLVALVAGSLIGLSLGTLGGGGSILAVPVLVYGLGQSPVQATTGSLVVVGVTALIGAAAALHAGNVLLGRGVVFGLVGIGGAVVGGHASGLVRGSVLLVAFSVLMLVVGTIMLVREWRRARRPGPPAGEDTLPFDEPIITFRPTFACHCPRALKVLVTATVVGLLTGFLGVGGGFLVVPALVLGLGVSMKYAAGTSLVVIALTSAAALVVRVGAGAAPDWWVVVLLTATAAAGAFVGARLVSHLDVRRLSIAFTALVLVVAVYTAVRSVPALVG